MEKQLGFLPDKEIAEQSAEDWIFGVGEVFTGLTEGFKMTGSAVYAWPTPINGVYPRVANTLNHAVAFIGDSVISFLPDGQIQRGREDWMNCATNAPCNLYESSFNYAIKNGLISKEGLEWLKQKGYIRDGKFEVSNAFNSILSGTTRNGNSLKAPFESIRKDGLVPLSLLPDDKSMTWAQYHNTNRITQELRDLGQEFLKRFPLNYEKVMLADMDEYLGFKWKVFDSYEDVDGDHIKVLAPTYNILSYSYRGIINEVKKNEPPKEEKGDEMTFFKASQNPDSGRLYQLGKGSGKYHHILDEPTFFDLYGDFSANTIIDLKIIPAEQIGRPVGQPNSFAQILTDFFKGLTGK